jgi:hypothetical protein
MSGGDESGSRPVETHAEAVRGRRPLTYQVHTVGSAGG